MTATTDATGGRLRTNRAVPTARTRILGWVLLLVGLALTGSIGATRAVLVDRLDDRIDHELTQEARKLRAFASSALDPRTGAAFTDVRALLDHYLTRNLPDRDETLFTLVDRAAASRSPGLPPVRLDTDRAFVRSLAARSDPAYGSRQTAAGEVRYAVLPVHVTSDPRPGAVVVAEFRDRAIAREVDPPTEVLVGVALAALLLAAVAGWLVAGRVLAPVRLVRQAAEEISATDLHRRIGPPDGDGPEPVRRSRHEDDVAALARTFDAMLDRIERAFVSQREFLDDAGHELRTPLTVVRGHLEVMGDDPAERAETLALVTDELDRMARIVDDLTTLAKAERPDFLAYGDVDAADLTVEVLAKARVLADRAWTLDEMAASRIRADGQRLTQALLQLASNAVRYTELGDTIAFGSETTSGATVRFWVRDSGAGVSPDIADRAFERFARAGPRGGAGLGLAIVRAIAVAHGGRAWLESLPGKGTTVYLEVPT